MLPSFIVVLIIGIFVFIVTIMICIFLYRFWKNKNKNKNIVTINEKDAKYLYSFIKEYNSMHYPPIHF